MRTSIVKVVLFAALAAGCTGTGQVTYSAGVGPPPLVEISPGVQVIADYDEPVFFSDDFYWRFDGGVWYRSRYHTRDWVRVEAPPPRIRQIDRPTAYIHYHAGARVDGRDHRGYQPPPPPPPAPVVRDHRDYQPPPPPPPAPAPVVRDHRMEPQPQPQPVAPPPVVRDHRLPDEKAERREQKEERRDDRKDRKDERKDDKKDKGDHRH
jgi:hypothetical protein